MPENKNNIQYRINALTDFARSLINGKDGRNLIEKYKNEIDTVTPFETMQVLDGLLVEGFETEKVKAYTGKIINVFFKSLSAFKWQKPGVGHFLHYLMLENREAEKIIKELRVVIKEYYHNEKADIHVLTSKLRHFLTKLNDYELHYIKKENILFPYIEKEFPQYRCLKLMWSFHDDFRRSLKVLDNILQNDSPDKDQLSRELGRLFFVVLPIIFREEQIVFPVALEALPEGVWTEMLKQSLETGWCYIQPPEEKFDASSHFQIDKLINLKSGFLSPEQIILLLNNLPVDITYVDENNEVRYFSSGGHRIFPRSNAIIGRKVQNCHPPGSVHIVNEIIDSFRNRTKDFAEFWINMKGRFIHIRYFALRNDHGEYKGVIEVSQDVTSIRELEGERRLLDW
jgi:uncharacterized protein